jgi:putative heme iron utilization protein
MKQPLAEYLASQPDGTLEQIATEYQVSLLDVVSALPNRTIVSAEHFDAVWDIMTEWGEVVMLKVFVGRDEHRQQRVDALVAFRELAQQLKDTV